MPALQLRSHQLNKKDFLTFAQEIAYLKLHHSFSFIINHHVDMTQELGADGVHLSSQSMAISEARKLLSEKAIIGSSVHSIEEGKQKEKKEWKETRKVLS